MLKKCYLLLCIFCNTVVFASQSPKFKVSGETDYSQQNTKSLITKIETDYRIKIYEPSHKLYCFWLGGKISTDYDHFGNDFKTNVFTTLGVDF